MNNFDLQIAAGEIKPVVFSADFSNSQLHTYYGNMQLDHPELCNNTHMRYVTEIKVTTTTTVSYSTCVIPFTPIIDPDMTYHTDYSQASCYTINDDVDNEIIRSIKERSADPIEFRNNFVDWMDEINHENLQYCINDSIAAEWADQFLNISDDVVL